MALRPQRRRVWVVDDSPTEARIACVALEEEYAVEVFHDGASALQRLSDDELPDVIILDWVMPELSGLDVCRAVRQTTNGSVSILMLTAQRDTAQIVEALGVGADDFLTKPYAPEELLARVGAQVRRRRLLERAELAESAVAKLLVHAPDALLALDERGAVRYANPEAERVLRRPAADLVGRPVAELLPQLPLSDALSGTAPEVRIADEIYAPAAQRLPAPDERGAVTTLALRQVTARREAALRRLDFYSIMAHDLRSPLAAILMRVSLALRGRRGDLPEAISSDIHRFDRDIRDLVDTLNDFLVLASLENGEQPIVSEELELRAVLHEAVTALRSRVQAKRLRLDLTVPPIPVPVLGDRMRLVHVLTNLLAHGIARAPVEGRLVARLALEEAGATFSIEDEASPVPEALLDSLFYRYRRPGDAGYDYTGSGLALIVVREIVELHGGSVGAENLPGRGSRLWARLPLALHRASAPPVV